MTPAPRPALDRRPIRPAAPATSWGPRSSGGSRDDHEHAPGALVRPGPRRGRNGGHFERRVRTAASGRDQLFGEPDVDDSTNAGVFGTGQQARTHLRRAERDGHLGPNRSPRPRPEAPFDAGGDVRGDHRGAARVHRRSPPRALHDAVQAGAEQRVYDQVRASQLPLRETLGALGRDADGRRLSRPPRSSMPRARGASAGSRAGPLSTRIPRAPRCRAATCRRLRCSPSRRAQRRADRTRRPARSRDARATSLPRAPSYGVRDASRLRRSVEPPASPGLITGFTAHRDRERDRARLLVGERDEHLGRSRGRRPVASRCRPERSSVSPLRVARHADVLPSAPAVSADGLDRRFPCREAPRVALRGWRLGRRSTHVPRR